MNEITRFASELAQMIAAAAAGDPRVEACRARAREAGYDLTLLLDAAVGEEHAFGPVPDAAHSVTLYLDDDDRRFLRSLKIGAGF